MDGEDEPYSWRAKYVSKIVEMDGASLKQLILFTVTVWNDRSNQQKPIVEALAVLECLCDEGIQQNVTWVTIFDA